MSLLKIPNLGSFFINTLPIAGQAASTTPEVSVSRFALSGATITLDGTNATVTLASHLNTIVGQQVTFSGATGVTAINGQTWTIGSIPSTGVYTFPCTLTGTVTGTIVQEPVFSIPAGIAFCVLGANARVEYNPDNTYNTSNGSANAPNWRTLIAASGTGIAPSDGFATRLRCAGTTATSVFSVV